MSRSGQCAARGGQRSEPRRRLHSFDGPPCIAHCPHVATYELERPEVLEAAAFLARVGDDFSPWSKRCLGRALLFRRRACAQILPGDAFPPAGSRALFLACGDVPAGHEVGFNRWYDEEHVPLLARVPGLLCARRFRARSATLRYVALYDLADESVSRAREWQAARETEWARRIGRLTESCEWILRTYRAYAPA